MPAVLTFAPIRGATHGTTSTPRHPTFQPTCPVRGTTLVYRAIFRRLRHFNPRAPYGARHRECVWCDENNRFQSTCPVRGTTEGKSLNKEAHLISIHVPCTGHDQKVAEIGVRGLTFQSTCPVRGTTLPISSRERQGHHFNPRAPYGARQIKLPTARTNQEHFNPRAPYGARPCDGAMLPRTGTISIHVPRTGHDVVHATYLPFQNDFNPRAPYGARLHDLLLRRRTKPFQSTCPVRGTTFLTPSFTSHHLHFNPRAPYGARRPPLPFYQAHTDFNPRAPYGARRF